MHKTHCEAIRRARAATDGAPRSARVRAPPPPRVRAPLLIFDARSAR